MDGKETAGPSTALRSGRDDKFVGELTERKPLCGSRYARDDKWRAVTFIRSRQIGWMEAKPQVPCI
jgi:hypothetical protein